MAGLFDFEKYYTNKVIKTSINLDVSGLDVKSTASSSVMNEDGSVDEADMNEYVTNNVMFKIASIQADGKDISVADRIVITTGDVDSDAGENTENYYIAIGYPLDDLIETGLYEYPEDYTGDLLDDIEIGYSTAGDDSESEVTLVGMKLCGPDDSDSEGKSVSKLVIKTVPRYALINPKCPTLTEANVESVDQNLWCQTLTGSTTIGDLSRALAAVGLQGDIYKGNKWANKQDSGKTKAVYKNRTFTRMINKISSVGRENNLAIKLTYFDESYADPLDPPEQQKGEKNKSYAKRRLKADWTRTNIKLSDTMNAVYGSTLNTFISKCNSHDPNPLPDLSNKWTTDVSDTGATETILTEDATALVPNVSDAFKKLYDDPSELAKTFEEKFFETYDSITHIAGVRPFMSSKLKRKLDFAKTALKKTADSKLAYYLDVASCCNLLESTTNHDDAGNDYISFPKYDGSCTTGIRMIGSRDFKVLLNNGRDSAKLEGEYSIGCYDASNSSYRLRPNYGDALLYETVSDSSYSDWAIEHSQMTVGELKSMLCDYFTAMYNRRHDVEEGEDGYIRWYYDATDYSEDASQNKAYKFELTRVTENDDGITTTQTYTTYVNAPTKAELKRIEDNAGKSPIFSINIRSISINSNEQTYSIDYPGTSRMFVDAVFQEISSLLNASSSLTTTGSTGKYKPTKLTDDMTIDVVEWDSCSTAGNYIKFADFRPMYQTIDGLGEATDYTINDCVKFATDVMGDALDEISNILTVQGFLLGPAFLLIQKLRLSDANDDYSDLEKAIKRIEWYQRFTNESVFYNKTFIGDRPSYDECPYVNMPARFLVPVELFKRVRIKYKRFFRTRHKTVKKSIGVRWVEVTFIDTDVYASYPQNTEEPMQYYPIGKYASVNGSNLVFSEPLEGGDSADSLDVGAITQFGTGKIVTTALKKQVAVTFSDSTTFAYDSNKVSFGTNTQVYVEGIYVPLEKTEKSDDLTRVRVEYKMPYIPYDSEIRRWAFLSYGAFDQSPYASESREVPADPDKKLPGWEIFHRSSKRIGDLRDCVGSTSKNARPVSMGIYDAVSILMGILRNEYGASCVELAETMRSKEDQELMSSGGGESTFLSWHNYGLAVKILINDPSTGLPIADGSEDMRKLIQIAKAFTSACYSGAFGRPINVVWCGRLKMGANIFVWEFLPIGVGHKDAIKFREALLNQEDPIATLGYVDVDEAGMVYDRKPAQKVPYVLRSGDTYRNAIMINGHHYVSPSNIRNYITPHDIVLKNILEFCNLIRTKMEANGSTLNGRANLYEWKTLNDRSYKQLLMYYGMTGSISAARALICGEYVEQYRNIVDRKFSENAVEMTREYLGGLYDDARIYIEDTGDGAAWISLHDGRMHIRASNLHSPYDQNSKDNFYGERMVTTAEMERGRYVDGIFYTDEYLAEHGHPDGLPLEIISEHSCINGLDDDGNVTGGDAMLLYRMISIQLKDAFDELKDTFENYGGNIMYDHFVDGPNAGMEDMVENEFGLIAGQDLIDFDSLEAIFAKQDVDEGVSQQYDETDGEVYEKVVSNAELAGIRKASLTREHINVTVQSGGLTTEKLYKLITKGGMTQATDMFTK